MENRDELLKGLDIRDGIIRSPGKFESDPVYAPHFYDCGLEGGADEEVDGVWFFDIHQTDRESYPEIPEDCEVISLSENDSGFINIGHHSRDEADNLIKGLEADSQGDGDYDGECDPD